MSPGPLLFDREKDTRRTKEELLEELAEMRRQIAALKESQAGSERIRREGEGKIQECNRITGMLDDIQDPVFILDDESRLTYVNSAAARLFNVNREDVPGKGLWDIYPKREGTLFYNIYGKARLDRKPACFREKHRLLGRWFEVSMYPVRGGMTILFRDITTTWHREEIQRLSLILLHNLKENIFLLRSDGRLFHSNPETRESLGYSSDELIRMTIFDLVPHACLKEWHDVLDRIRQKGSMTFESRLKTRDGREFPVEVYGNYIQLYGHDYYTVSARDITDRKEAERKLAEYRAEADASKEQTELYLDLMGHDIKNLNMLAMGNLEMAIANLEQTCTLKPEEKELLDRSLESLSNSSELISNVQKLQQASTEGLKLKPMDMAKVIEESVNRFRDVREKQVDIHVRHVPSCMVNANELLKDVFANIIGNAIKHSTPGENLTITIAMDAVVEGDRTYCRASVEDNGPGIPDDTKVLLFKRYVRGKTKAKGSGLGLYLVRTLLELYGGSIKVEDRVQGDHTQGARFVITIPAVDS